MYEVLVLDSEMCHKYEAEIRELLTQLSSKPERPINFERTISAPQAYVVGALYGSELVGMLLATEKVHFFHSDLYLDEVVVRSDFRHQGCLRAMTEFCKQLASDLGCTQIQFTSSRPNAQAAYGKLGFTTPTKAFRLDLK